jgi:hypothetical protein
MLPTPDKSTNNSEAGEKIPPQLRLAGIDGRFHRGGIIQGVLLYTTNPWKTTIKSMREWDYRTKIIPLL